MKKSTLFLLFFFTFYNILYSQVNSSLDISTTLKENANLVYRKNHKDIIISNQQKMTIKTSIEVVILNENGWRNIEIGEYYSKSDKIKSIEAVIYNASGKEIKKVKRSDFKDSSVADGFSVYTDNRVLALEYIPLNYPFTISYSSIVETPNTAFIPSWFPINSTYVSIENASITVSFPSELGFRYKKYNLEQFSVEKEEKENFISFSIKNLPAFKNEDYSPSIYSIVPYIRFALQKFHLEGVDGEASSWEELGKWMDSALLSKTTELSEATKKTILELVQNETESRKKAEIIYEYVQSKTRYVSIQLGIGGWKPISAKEVDRLGYGDCKALTNYTKALLDVVGIPSYYTIINNSNSKRDLSEDFVSMQGNHVILAVPDKDNLLWLECTSQIVPFNYIGSSNDDRLVLSIKPEGGKLLKTHQYKTNENRQTSLSEYSIDENGKLNASLEIKSQGTQYGNKFYLERQTPKDINDYYKRYFSVINNLTIKNVKHDNNKEQIEFTETIILEADNYATKNGNKLMFSVNPFNQISGVPQRYRNRNNPFEITRGYSDFDTISVSFPNSYSVESIPSDFELDTEFGYYKTEYEIKNDVLKYKRTMILKNGTHPKEKYNDFRSFMEQVARNDNAKIILNNK